MTHFRTDTLIFGGGLAGLSAGYTLTRAGAGAVVLESGSHIGGLARTIEHDGYRFDLGGHRFLTGNKAVGQFVADLLGDELAECPRTSKIFLHGKYFDYPLRPANALFGLGVRTTLRVLSGYCLQQARNAVVRAPAVSLEDWVVARFGRAMFDLYFRDYSEKVWGIPCGEISAEWVARRIAGLSLGEALRNAFSKQSGNRIQTLADRFLYPALGIGRIAERLQQEISARNEVRTGAPVLRVSHEAGRVRSVLVRVGDAVRDMEADAYISTLPLTGLVQMLHPAAPEFVREAARGLRFRDLIVVAVMIDRERVTDLSWMYLPEKRMTPGRIHEPGNWSRQMAPEGRTHLVAEYFCFRNDEVWKSSDRELTERTVKQLSGLGLFRKQEVLGSRVVRVPRAYPILDTGYRARHEVIMSYLSGFRNLRVAGRGGTFQYLNMDHAIESGIDAAAAILANGAREQGSEAVHAGSGPAVNCGVL